MNFLKKVGIDSILMLVLCFLIVLVAEYLFLTGNKLHGIFIGMWVPTILCIMIYLKLVKNGRK